MRNIFYNEVNIFHNEKNNLIDGIMMVKEVHGITVETVPMVMMKPIVIEDKPNKKDKINMERGVKWTI